MGRADLVTHLLKQPLFFSTTPLQLSPFARHPRTTLSQKMMSSSCSRACVLSVSVCLFGSTSTGKAKLRILVSALRLSGTSPLHSLAHKLTLLSRHYSLRIEAGWPTSHRWVEPGIVWRLPHAKVAQGVGQVHVAAQRSYLSRYGVGPHDPSDVVPDEPQFVVV